MPNVKEIVKSFKEFLSADYDPEELDQIIVASFEHVCAFSRADLILSASGILTKTETDELLRIQDSLRKGYPIQHILGYSWFMDNKYKVSADVLIPRPETEELVRWVVDDHVLINSYQLNVLDVCTGSACIALSLTKFYPSWNIKALDISEPALKIAAENMRAHNASIKLFKADILDWKNDRNILSEFTQADRQSDGLDVIVSNPPYIPESMRTRLSPRVAEHEPSIALFVPDNDPIIFYRAIAEFSLAHLRTGGKLYFEINRDLGPEIVEMLVNLKFSSVQLRKDIQGNNRMISASLNL